MCIACMGRSKRCLPSARKHVWVSGANVSCGWVGKGLLACIMNSRLLLTTSDLPLPWGFSPVTTVQLLLDGLAPLLPLLLLQATYDLPTSKLGGILFGANVIGGLSSLASGWVANRFGLVNTMVFT